MSHELRTPFNGVIGFTRQMLKTGLSAANRLFTDHQTLDNNLLTIINDVLDFSKLEASKLVLEHIPFALRETLDEVVVLLAPAPTTKGLGADAGYCTTTCRSRVIGDSLRLQQIITNLLGNAIRFTRNRQYRYPRRAAQTAGSPGGSGSADPRHRHRHLERQQSQLFQSIPSGRRQHLPRRHGGTELGLVITQKAGEGDGRRHLLPAS